MIAQNDLEIKHAEIRAGRYWVGRLIHDTGVARPHVLRGVGSLKRKGMNNLPDDWSWKAFDEHFGDNQPPERDEADVDETPYPEDFEPVEAEEL